VVAEELNSPDVFDKTWKLPDLEEVK